MYSASRPANPASQDYGTKGRQNLITQVNMKKSFNAIVLAIIGNLNARLGKVNTAIQKGTGFSVGKKAAMGHRTVKRHPSDDGKVVISAAGKVEIEASKEDGEFQLALNAMLALAVVPQNVLPKELRDDYKPITRTAKVKVTVSPVMAN